jgi:uncharacterized membrane protein YccF (DUF307 family)
MVSIEIYVMILVQPVSTSCNECTDFCVVPYTWDFVDLKLLPQLATVQHCFCTSIFKYNGFVH